MGEGENETWRGPAQVVLRGWRRWLGIFLPIFWAALGVLWFIDWRNGEASGWLVMGYFSVAVIWALMLLPNGTTVKADPVGLRVFNPANPSWRRVRWDQISHFQRREPWGMRREDLLVAIKHDGGRVLIGLPEGHRGLVAWWARHGSQSSDDRSD